jgi:serine/threonine protein kinase
MPAMGEPGQLPPCPHCRAQHPEELLLCPNTNRLLPLEGRVLDHRFRFIKQLGEGGMSTVWMAENFRVRKRVAIKVMHPEFARNPRTLHRFQNEATAAGRIGNPHICDIIDLGESPLGPYIVMEMLQGQSFAELLEDQGRIDPPLAVLIICEALKGLAAAHAAGIIHRDLKPENVFLHEPAPGHMLVKLMDFGISKFTEETGGGRTGANVVMGTPEYMSPEQAAGAANADARTDIWAMGVMLYRALTGVEPFRGKTMAALLLALSTDDHAPVDSYLPGLSKGLIAVIDRCLVKEPSGRFATADQLRAALLPYQQLVAEGEQPALPPVRSGKTTPPIMAAQPAMPTVPPAQTIQPGQTMQPGQPAMQPAMQYASRAESPGPGHAQPRANPTLDVTGPTGAHAAISPEARFGKPSFVDNTPTGSKPGASREAGGTWSSEMRAPVDSDQSWSMGQRTFSEEESRPYTPTTQKREQERGWIGWAVGLGLLVLLGGGVAVALSSGIFAGDDDKVAKSDEGETGTIAPAETGGSPPDLPIPPSETSAETGTEPSTTTGEATTAGTTAGTTDTADDAGSTTTGGGGTTGGGTTGGSTTGGGTTGGSTTGGDDEGGDDGGETPPRLDFANLIREGSLYTHKSRGPNGNWASANDYCRGYKRKKRHGLTKWRMATVAELQAFRATEVDRLLYWSAEVTGDKAKVVSMVAGSTADKLLTDPAPRAFCVSRR